MFKCGLVLASAVAAVAHRTHVFVRVFPSTTFALPSTNPCRRHTSKQEATSVGASQMSRGAHSACPIRFRPHPSSAIRPHSSQSPSFVRRGGFHHRQVAAIPSRLRVHPSHLAALACCRPRASTCLHAWLASSFRMSSRGSAPVARTCCDARGASSTTDATNVCKRASCATTTATGQATPTCQTGRRTTPRE